MIQLYFLSSVLSSDPFHGVVWMLLSMGIIGNILVVVWRLAQKRGQRSSPLSVLIIMLAVSDFLYCFHLLLLESLVLDVNLDQTKHLSPISARNMCTTSAWLSLFSCLTAQWATFNIAVYSFQAMSDFCSRCCCSLVHKRSLVITIICQVLINVVITLICMIENDNYRDASDALFDLSLQDYVKRTGNDSYSNWTDVNIYSRRERIAQIFGRCAWAQSNGFGDCLNETFLVTDDNSRRITWNVFCAVTTIYGKGTKSTFQVPVIGSFIALLGSILTLTSAILYICFWIKLRATAANLTGRSEMHKLRWRLTVIVLLDTLCWIPVTILHWIVISDPMPNTNIEWSNDTTAANVLLISISPAVNPLIYTFTGKNFLHSIRKFCRRMKCDVSVRQTSSNYPDDHTRGVERCSCIPCIRCVHHDEENDPDNWRTQDTSAWNSDQSRLLPSTNESSETN